MTSLGNFGGLKFGTPNVKFIFAKRWQFSLQKVGNVESFKTTQKLITKYELQRLKENLTFGTNFKQI